MKLFATSLALIAIASTMTCRADKPRSLTVPSSPILRAQGHPMHVDFVAKSSKRVDLRANVTRKGLDTAFTEWLRSEHPHVYKRDVERLARL